MDFILNEESLKGQFDTVDKFLETLSVNVRCFSLIHKNRENNIYKIADFYKCNLTPNKRICDLKKYQYSDELLRFQIQLDQEIATVPYWDENPSHNMNQVYYWDENDVTATAIAEAAEKNGPLLSFKLEAFVDKQLKVLAGTKIHMVESVYTPKYLAEVCSQQIGLSRIDLLKIKYEGTRVDCTFLEDKYGPSLLEEHEYALLIASLDKFVNHDSWENIDKDDGLRYKKYKPSDKDDWFRNSPFQKQTIMKFRFSDVLRGYGYRHKDRFRLLRLERNHKKSDKG